MEALLVRPNEEKSGTLARRVSRLLLADDDEGRVAIESEVKRLYALRSDAAHLGLSSAALANRSSIIVAFAQRLPMLLQAAASALSSGQSFDDWISKIEADG